MRTKIAFQPSFPFVLGKPPKIYVEFQQRYNRIDKVLDETSAVLEAFHADIASHCSDEGRESQFSSEQFFRMIVIKTIEGLSYRDTIIRVTDSDFLRNFVRIGSGDLMSFAALEMAAKCVSAATWDKINAILSNYARRKNKISGKRLRIDSTVCESNIHYPTDASLLWDCCRVASRLMRQCVDADYALDIGVRFHDRKAKQLYTFIATHAGKKTAATKRAVRRRTKKLIASVERICSVGHRFVRHADEVRQVESTAMRALEELRQVLPLMEQVAACAWRVYQGETVPASDRIFSIFEPHTELLKRGKAHKPVEFGHMVSIGQTAEKFISFYRVEQKSRHDIHLGDEALKEHKRQFGRYPQQFAADKNYYGGPEHQKKWQERIRVYAVGKKGRRDEEETQREHGALFRLLQKFRAGCEGSISVLKRVFGLVRCLNRGFNSFASSIGSMVFCHNLVVLSRI